MGTYELARAAWTAARLAHQAEWDDLSALNQHEFLTHADWIIAGNEPAEGDDNFARFEKALSVLLLAPEPEAVEVAEEVVEEAPPMAMAAPIPEDKPKPKPKKRAIKKPEKVTKVAKKVPQKTPIKTAKKPVKKASKK